MPCCLFVSKSLLKNCYIVWGIDFWCWKSTRGRGRMSKFSPSGWQLFPPSTENPVFFLANDFCSAMVNCFHGMVYKQTTLSLISSWGYCQRLSSWATSSTPQAGYELTWVPKFKDCWIKYALVLTTVPQADHLCKSEKTKKIDPLGTQTFR